ncbi:MAG: ABC transporter permease subunit [Mycobacterium sp.]|nr:ABC transporter permease subunit [Mycobacterium sp.]
MIFDYVSVSIPFSISLLVGHFEAVTRSLDEAAILDGCSQFQVIWRIIFPIMLPGISRPRPMRFCCAGRNIGSLS